MSVRMQVRVTRQRAAYARERATTPALQRSPVVSMRKADAVAFLRSIPKGETVAVPIPTLQHGSEIGKRLLDVSYMHSDLRIRYLSCPDPDKTYLRIWRD